MALTDKLTNIANAIREKTGLTNSMTLDEMATNIMNISSGESSDISGKILNKTIKEYTNNDINTIGDYAFYNCDRLTSISSSRVSGIGQNAFVGCSRLNTVYLPNVINIGAYAFSGCEYISTLNIQNVTSIGSYAFRRCRGVKSIEFLNNVTFGTYAFYDSFYLKTIILRNTNNMCTLINKNAFEFAGISNIYVPDELVEQYKIADNWSNYATQIKPLSEYEGG